MADDSFVPVDAIEFLSRKKIVPTDSWDDLWQGENSHAFTVAHSIGAAVLDDILGAVKRAQESGETLESFKKNLEPMLKEKGWWGGISDKVGDEQYLGWRMKMIYDTNLLTAYSAGTYRRMTRQAELRPIWVYSAVMDSHTRPAHRYLHGKAFRADHPFWDEYYPPNGWRCRCGTYSLSKDEAAAHNINILEDIPDDLDLEKVAPPEWRYNPGKEAWSPDWSKYTHLSHGSGGSLVAVVKKKWAEDLNTHDAAPRQDAPSVASDEFVDRVTKRINKSFTTEADVCTVGQLILEEVQKHAVATASLIFNILKRIRPFDIETNHTFIKRSSLRGKDIITKAQAFFPREWLILSQEASRKNPMKLRLNSSRSYYENTQPELCIRDSLFTAIHELVHRMEFTVPTIKQLEKSFYDRRTAGEERKSLREVTGLNYRKSEYTKVDKFIHPYVGKDYNGEAYEVFSMGLETLIQNPHTLIEVDKDFVEFILGLLAGG